MASNPTNFVEVPDTAVPYPSLDALKDGHARLLKLQQDIHAQSMISEVEIFLRQGAATGALLDSENERSIAQSLLDYWVTKMYRIQQSPPESILVEFDPELCPKLDDADCPYMGLAAFQEQQKSLFFGREHVLQAAISKLADKRLLGILGSSGSGKSSLALAGLIPLLKEGAVTGSGLWKYYPPMVPGSDPLRNLSMIIKPQDGDAGEWVPQQVRELQERSDHLLTFVNDQTTMPALIVIDQFEEIFTLCTDEGVRQTFIENLLRFVQAPERKHRVILTMRTDFFEDKLVQLPVVKSLVDNGAIRLTALSSSELLQAIEGPAKQVGLKFEDGIKETLVRDILGEATSLPLLQFTLLRLWKYREGNRITWKAYKKLGNAREALARTADEFYNQLLVEQQETVKRIMLRLVRPSEGLEVTSNRMRREMLYKTGEAGDRVDAVLQKLIEEGLVRLTKGETQADDQVEVAHEALIRNWNKLLDWLGEERVRMKKRIRLTMDALQWRDHGEDPGALIAGSVLEDALQYDDLNDLETGFVQASQAAVAEAARQKVLFNQREVQQAQALAQEEAKVARRQRWLIIVLGFGFIGALVGGYATWTLWQRAEGARQEEQVLRIRVEALNENEKKAKKSRELALQALEHVDDRMDLALLLSAEALLTADEQQLRSRHSLIAPLTANLKLAGFLHGHTDSVRTVAFSPDGTLLASGGNDNAIVLWNLEHNVMQIPPLVEHQGQVFKVAFNQTGDLLVSGSSDKSVILWDTKRGELVHRFLHEEPVFTVAFSPDGTKIAAGGKDGKITLWNVKTRERAGILENNRHTGEVYDIAFSHDGALLASAGQDRKIIFWDMKTGLPDKAPLPGPGNVFALAFSHDDKTIATGNNEGRLDIWDVAGRKWKTLLHPEHTRGVYGLAFSPDDTWLVSTSKDGTVVLRDMRDLKSPGRVLKGYTMPFFGAAFSPNGILANGADDGTVVLWSPLLGDLKMPYRFVSPFPSEHRTTTTIRFSPTETLAASGSEDDRLMFWDVEKGVPKGSVLPANQSGIDDIVFNADGKALLSAGLDGSIKLWDAKKEPRFMKILRDPQGEHARRIEARQFSPNGTLLAEVNCGDEPQCKTPEVRLWNVNEARASGKFSLNNPVGALAFIPDGRVLAIAEWDNGITLWDATKGERLPGEPLQHPNVMSLAFSRDGKLLASGGKDSFTILWDIATGRMLGSPFGLGGGQISNLQFNRDGRVLVTASLDRKMILWEVKSQIRMSRPMQADQKQVTSLAFSPDGRWLLTGSEDGWINRWTFDPNEMQKIACEVADRNLTKPEQIKFLGAESNEITCPNVLVRQADALMLSGDPRTGEQVLSRALDLALKSDDEDFNNKVCWIGSLHGMADMVLPACERAVELAPQTLKNLYADSRGLARALTGNTQGALADFKKGLEAARELSWTKEYLQRREQWIEALENKRNPFKDRATLMELRTESQCECASPRDDTK